MEKFKTPYFNEITRVLERLETSESAPLETAARWTADALERGGLIHAFGCGHSASPALEAFHRSGCFAAVNVILDPGLQFQQGAARGTALERQEGYTPALLAGHDLREGDVFFVFSNSGRNPAGVDAVLYAREKGVKTIAVTAAGAHKNSRSRHSSGKMLSDAADLTLDNHCSANETCLTLDGAELAPLSTVAACALFHAALYRAAQILAERGVTLPVYQSSNVPGNDEKNDALSRKYRARVKHL